MRKEITNHHKTISSARPEEFDNMIEAVIQLPNLTNYRLTYRGDGLIACIEYQTETTIFENIKEEYEARGDVYYCDDCPYMRPIEDHRHKHHECKCGTTSPTKKACLRFYQDLAKGVICL